MTKNKLKRGERNDTYLIHVCSLPQSIESSENKYFLFASQKSADMIKGTNMLKEHIET